MKAKWRVGRSVARLRIVRAKGKPGRKKPHYFQPSSTEGSNRPIWRVKCYSQTHLSLSLCSKRYADGCILSLVTRTREITRKNSPAKERIIMREKSFLSLIITRKNNWWIRQKKCHIVHSNTTPVLQTIVSVIYSNVQFIKFALYFGFVKSIFAKTASVITPFKFQDKYSKNPFKSNKLDISNQDEFTVQ